MSAAEIAARTVEAVTSRLRGAEVVSVLERSEDHLTRFADSAIHQNVADEAWTASVTAHLDGRTLRLTTGLAGPEDGGAIEAVADRVAQSLALAPLDPRWAGVAGAAEVAAEQERPGSTPAERAAAVAAFIEGAGGLSTAGYVKSYRSESGVATSGGQIASMRTGASAIDGIASINGVDGVSRSRVHAFADLDPYAAGALAAAKARAAQDAAELRPGRYEVILEPAAAANIVSTLAMYGFNGRMALDGASFVELGTQQFDPSISLVDDGPAWGVTVDSEGTPKQRLAFVEGGRATRIAHDRRTAAESGGASTGHGSGYGVPDAAHLGIEPGVAAAVAASPVHVAPTAASLLAGVTGSSRALLVSDFWYTRVLDPRQVTVTGLTRNGMWLVENGAIVGAVQNVRFTQSYPGALAPGQVLGVGPDVVTDPDSWAPTAHFAPALHLASWNVTGNASG